MHTAGWPLLSMVMNAKDGGLDSSVGIADSATRL